MSGNWSWVRLAWRCIEEAWGIVIGICNGASHHYSTDQTEGETNTSPHGWVDNLGKTTILMRLNGDDTSLVTPTLGFNIKTLTYLNSDLRRLDDCKMELHNLLKEEVTTMHRIVVNCYA
ncbi:hypothetical protein ACLB2K_035237 [Fragaria x ananassa]